MWALLLIATALGTILFWLGLRGRRIDDHPLCRRCRYDLVGAIERPQICPECGADLTGPRALRIGHRRKRRLALSLGSLILLLALAGGGFLGWSEAQGFNWYPYKPVWLLRRDATGTDPAKTIASQKEILARLAEGHLSQTQIDSIVAEALKAQADPSATWFHFWGDFIESGWLTSLVSDVQVARYLENAAKSSLRLSVSPRVRSGGTAWLYHHQDQARVGSGDSTFSLRVVRDWPLLDGHPLYHTSGESLIRLSSGGSGSTGVTFKVTSGPGPYSIVQNLSIQAMADRHQSLVQLETPVKEWSMRLETTMQVVGPDEPIVALAPDESLRDQIRDAVRLLECQVMALPNRDPHPIFMMQFDALPVDVAFEVFWRIGEREWPVDEIARAAGRHGHVAIAASPAQRIVPSVGRHQQLPNPRSFLNVLAGFPRTAERVDVILRSSAAVAERTGRLESIWDGEIIIEDVALTWRDAPSAKRAVQ